MASKIKHLEKMLKLDLDVVLIDQEIRQRRRKLDLHPYLLEILTVLLIRLILIQLLILHEHDCNGQIEQEERADHDTKHEVNLHEPGRVGVLVNVHDLGPALHGDALEDSQKCEAYVVE